MFSLLCNATQVAKGDLASVVIVEQLEHLLDILAGVLLAHLASHHLEELGELNLARAVGVNVGDPEGGRGRQATSNFGGGR